MPVPDITHLQFLVLDTLGGSDRCGKDVRQRLAGAGERKTLPAFYMMMGRLEDAGLVKGWYKRIEVEGHSVQERWYKATGSGVRAWREVMDFYAAKEASKAKGGLARA